MNRASLKQDVVSGFLVFLIALPLSIGIAVASGFPPLSGLLTAAVGGVLGGLLSGAPITIKGPAAGLIVIALGAIEALGGVNDHGIERALAAIAVAGVIQMVFAALRAGKMADFFPTSAVHGMLAAIGLIIVSKQIHVALGVAPQATTPLSLLAEIPHSIEHMNPEIALIGLVSIGLMFLVPRLHKLQNFQFMKKVPTPLLVLSVAIPLGLAFNLATKHAYNLLGHEYLVGPSFLINIPANVRDAILTPDFSRIFSMESIKYIVMFALVGSLESLLTVKAIDSLDPEKRRSNMNRDLMAVGIGNTLCGLVGGLPMISEVVRSSANLANGAKSRYANVFHGLFILAFVALVPQFIHLIPASALAGVLIFTGYRLASPTHWKETWHVGREQFVVFAITVVMTLATDLLIGIFTGVAIEVAINFFHGARPANLFKANLNVEETNSEGHAVVHLKDALTFSNVGHALLHMRSIAAERLTINVRGIKFADHTAVKSIDKLRNDLLSSGRDVRLEGVDALAPFSRHPHSALKVTSNGTDHLI